MRRQAEKTHLSSHANLHIFKEMPKRSGISRRFSLRGCRQIASSPRLFHVQLLVSALGGEVLDEKTCLCRKKRRPPYESGERRFKSPIPNIISFTQNQTNDDLFSFTRRMNFRNFGLFWAHRGEKFNEGAPKALQIAKHRAHPVRYRPKVGEPPRDRATKRGEVVHRQRKVAHRRSNLRLLREIVLQ